MSTCPRSIIPWTIVLSASLNNFQQVFLPLPENLPAVSHPVDMWKPINALPRGQLKAPYFGFSKINSLFFPWPISRHGFLEYKLEQGIKHQCPLTEYGLLHFHFDWPHQLHVAVESFMPPADWYTCDCWHNIIICLVGCYTIRVYTTTVTVLCDDLK